MTENNINVLYDPKTDTLLEINTGMIAGVVDLSAHETTEEQIEFLKENGARVIGSSSEVYLCFVRANDSSPNVLVKVVSTLDEANNWIDGVPRYRSNRGLHARSVGWTDRQTRSYQAWPIG